MPENKTPNKCSDKSSDSSSDSSSSSSSSSESIRMFIKQKHHSKKEKKHSSSSKIEGRKHKHHKHKHGKHKHKKCSKSRSKSKSKSKSKSNSRSSNTSCSDKSLSDMKYTFEDLYNFYKCKLMQDKSLMVNGCTSYIYAYDNQGQTIPQDYAVNFPNNGLNNHIDHVAFNAPFFVRESGIYVYFYVSSNEQSCQYSLFVNGKYVPFSTSGNNAGAGQMVIRNLIELDKNDSLIMRNYNSSAASVQSNTGMGGTQIGNNETFLLMKIAPLPSKEKEASHIQNKCDKYDKCNKNNKCKLSRRKKYLFKKLLEKMLLDKDLMLKGFNIRGTFYNTQSQSVLTESPVVFSNNQNVNGLLWDPINPTNINILEDGIYKVFSFVTTNTAAQFSFAVNGVPVSYATQGTNKGAGQLSLRSLLELKAGDVLTLINHTSSNGQITLSQEAGGLYQSMSALLTIFKISPLTIPQIPQCNSNEYYEKCFEQFKKFLLGNKCLQITGSSAYISCGSTNTENVPIYSSFSYEINETIKSVSHQQGTSEIVIERDGIYDIFSDIITDEPSQFTLFVNGTPDWSTVSGRDSGANRCLMRQFIKLSKGDIITVRNFASHSGVVHTSQNTGGSQIGHPVLFMAFLLCPFDECDNCHNLPPAPVPQQSQS
jgi:hypothetical protein